MRKERVKCYYDGNMVVFASNLKELREFVEEFTDYERENWIEWPFDMEFRYADDPYNAKEEDWTMKTIREWVEERGKGLFAYTQW